MSGGHRPSLRFQALKLEAQPAFFARAACVGMGALMFSEDTGGVKRARAICNGATDDKTGEQLTAPCPVKTECLEHVLERYSATEDYGVAGGLSARARRKLRRAIAAAIDPTPARPLKHGTRYAYNTGCGCLECST